MLNISMEDTMRQVGENEVALETPSDVYEALRWCEERGIADTVFFVVGGNYKPVGRCTNGERPKELIECLKAAVRIQPDVHARVGECLT